MTDLQPLQQHQNAVNKANNGMVGNNLTGKGNPGKLTITSSSNIDMTTGNNSASPLTSASVTSPAALTKEARGRVTRSSLGKAPLSLKSCEQVQQTCHQLAIKQIAVKYILDIQDTPDTSDTLDTQDEFSQPNVPLICS